MSIALRVVALLLLACGQAAAQPPIGPGERSVTRPLELSPGRPLDRQILVTFADPHGARVDLSGRPGPRYQRGTTYRVSTDVRQAARRLATEFGLETVDEWPIRPLAVYCLVYSVPPAQDVEALLERLNARAEIQSAQRLNVFETQSPLEGKYDDPYVALQHGLETLQVSEAHDWSVGQGITVAVVDTGADVSHPDLRTQIARHKDFVGKAGGAAAKRSDERHGTALAGIIGAAANNGVGIVGVAPGARLHVLKACWHPSLDAPAVCTSFTLARALSHAIESRVDVINLSLAGPDDPLLSALLSVALAQDVAVVAAMPASGAPSGFPAGVPGVLVVDLVEAPAQRGAPGESLRAPGRDVLVAAPAGQFELASGTSLAAAHVSGVIALLKAREPALGIEGVRDLLHASPAVDGASVNACRALAALLERSGCSGSGPAITRLGTE